MAARGDDSSLLRVCLALSLLGLAAPFSLSSLPASTPSRHTHVHRVTCNLKFEEGAIPRRTALLSGAAAWYVAAGSQAPAFAQEEEAATAAVAAKVPGQLAPWEGKRKPVPTWTLDGDVQMPVLALNTVALSVEDTERAVRLAMASGITHIDFHPGKERDGVAKVLASGVPASRFFLTTKIRKAPPGTEPSEAADMARNQISEDLEALGVDRVDMLMLRDSPDCEVMQAQWKVLEAALAAGQTRSIGVINFCESALKCVLKTAKVKPAVNYYMLHAGMGPEAGGLRAFCEKQNIRTFAYGAIGEPGPSAELLASSVLRRIGNAHQRSPVEVAVRWVLQNGNAVSVRPTADFDLGRGPQRPGILIRAGIKQRAELFGWSLTNEEMQRLDEMTSPDGNPTLFSSSGCPGAFVMPAKP